MRRTWVRVVELTLTAASRTRVAKEACVHVNLTMRVLITPPVSNVSCKSLSYQKHLRNNSSYSSLYTRKVFHQFTWKEIVKAYKTRNLDIGREM